MFVQVGERGTVTLGAAAARVPQSVASRRIAALEKHFGEHLFDRSSRRVSLTPFGRDLLPAAKNLVRLADELEYHADQARLRPITVALPDTGTIRQLARLHAAALDEGINLDIRTAAPAERTELLATREVRVILAAVPPDEATWAVPLGVATARESGTTPLRIDTLRPTRAQRGFRRIWLQPEDDVPHVRDRLEQLAHRAALVRAQVSVSPTLTTALSDLMRTDNLLLCSPAQAADLDLHWRPLADASLARGFTALAGTPDDAHRLTTHLGPELATTLGATDDVREPTA